MNSAFPLHVRDTYNSTRNCLIFVISLIALYCLTGLESAAQSSVQTLHNHVRSEVSQGKLRS